MNLFGRRRGQDDARAGRRRGRGPSPERQHLERFVAEHTGVEAFVEPPTAVTGTTVVLVANTGEWTRRRVPDARVAHEWANNLGIPSYDAAVVGYPQRMRDWNSRKAAEEKAAEEKTAEEKAADDRRRQS